MRKLTVNSLQLTAGVWALLSPAVAFAAAKTFAELVGQIIFYINFIIPIIISLAVLLYVRNTATGIWKMKDGKADPDWKTGMLWGIIAITLMVSLWGILTILANTFQIPVR